MPDTWETANGLDPLDPSDAGSDADGDGATALEEYTAGTDPTDPASVPAAPAIAVQWNAPSERTDGTSLAMSEIDGYRIYWAESGQSLQAGARIDDAYQTEYVIEGLESGTTYRIAVTAIASDGGESDRSETVSVTP
ncbi:hypothetical protein KBTX_00494 [wastewater metagenome]|uniref:Fibronectin type-III domain-containing protein n=4 Tax=root TaxID=1 RepID=A0A5B8R6E5_9ZZZZ|nr:hypothetical protein KBTEX_00494 [uncultured organism]